LPACVDERKYLVTVEVGCLVCALNKSILAVNGAVSASLVWEPMFQIWYRSFKNWGQ